MPLGLVALATVLPLRLLFAARGAETMRA